MPDPVTVYLIIATLVVVSTFCIAFGRIGAVEERLGGLEAALRRNASPQPASTAAQRSAPLLDLDARLIAEIQMFSAAGTAPDLAPPPNATAAPANVPEPAIPESTPSEPQRARPDASEPVAADVPARAPRVKAPMINWELFAGGRLLNVIGAIVLVIGIGSLLKYAWDENWVSVPLRIAAGVVAGFALLACGHVSHVRAKSKWFEHGLFGAGLGTLYVSGYSAFAGYHLVPFTVAYAFMSVVTLVAFVLSVKYESLPMALIGWFGGFVTPFAISDGGDNALGLASYIVLLDIGLVFVSLARRDWFGLQPLALAASYVTAFAWYSQHAADVTVGVAALGLASMWLVFFASGVVEVLGDRSKDSPAFSLLKRGLTIGNAVVFWTFEHFILADDANALALVSLGAAIAYGAAYVLFVKRTPLALAERLQYALGAAAMLAGAIAAHFEGFAVVTALTGSAILVAASSLLRRRLGVEPAAVRESFFAAGSLLGVAVLEFVFVPSPFAFGGALWSFAFGQRDLAVLSLLAGAIAVDRCTRGTGGQGIARLALRGLSLVALATLESVHFSQYGLVTCYAADAIVLASFDRGLRAFGRSYASALEANVSSLLFLLASVLSFSLTPDAFAFAGGSWTGAPGGRDGALLALAACCFALDRVVVAGPAGTRFGIAFRQAGVLAILVLDAVHAHNLGLATVLAIESVAIVICDRVLARFGRSYAPGSEPVYVATALAAIGWIAYAASDSALSFAGTRFALGFGRVDSTLLALAVSAIVLEVVYRRRLVPAASAAYRLSAVIAMLVATFVHASGLRFGEAIAFEGLILAVIGTRAMFRDLEIAGMLATPLAIVAILATPDAWHASDIFRFVPFADARFYAIVVTGCITFAAGEVYRRRSTLPPWFARTGRIAGIGLATFACTVEIRDIFELAIARAHNELATAANVDLLARLVNSEGLAISAVWVCASIAVIAAGIVFRVKEFRIAAIALFDLTILKAFFIDLSSLATPYRIVSFIGLGLVLLAVSYVYQRLEGGFFERPAGIDELLDARAV